MANKRQKTKGKNKKNRKEPPGSVYDSKGNRISWVTEDRIRVWLLDPEAEVEILCEDPQQQRMDAVGFPPLEGPGDR